MSEQKEMVPLFDMKNVSITEPLKLKLDCSKAVKEGNTTYPDGTTGTWRMWFGFVENVTVTEGRKPNQTTIENYTGKVIFFPTDKVNEQLLAATGGTERDVEVEITKQLLEGPKGPYRVYTVTKTGRDSTSSSSDMSALFENFTPTEIKLIEDAKSVMDSGIEIDENSFVRASNEPQYENKITEDRARELFKLLRK